MEQCTFSQSSSIATATAALSSAQQWSGVAATLTATSDADGARIVALALIIVTTTRASERTALLHPLSVSSSVVRSVGAADRRVGEEDGFRAFSLFCSVEEAAVHSQNGPYPPRNCSEVDLGSECAALPSFLPSSFLLESVSS